MIKRLRLAWYWLRSRYALQNTFVRCGTCPHWIFHSHVKPLLPMPGSAFGEIAPLALDYRAGICALDRPKVFNDFTTGFAFKAWTGHDWCPRHPLYDPRIVQGSDLQYRPGEDTLGAAGFDRLPTFKEAVAMAVKDAKMAQSLTQSLNQSISSMDASNDTTPNDDHSRRS